MYLKVFGKTVLETGKEARSLENPNVSLSDPDAWNDIFGLSENGVPTLNHNSALTLSAVYRAIVLLSGHIAALPFRVYQRDNGTKTIKSNHNLDYLLHKAPSNLYTSFIFRERLMKHLLTWGDGMARIIRNRFYEIESFKLYHPKDVTVIERNGELWYKVPDKKTPVPATDMIHVPAFGDGIRGLDPISLARQSLQGGLNMQFTGNRVMKNGHFNDRYISVPQKLTDDQYKRLSKSLKASYGGMANAGELPIIENQGELKSLGVKPENLQFLESRKFQINEVARWFGLPPHKLADLDRSTNNNIEHQAIEMVTDTIQFWTIRIEQEFNRKVFTREEIKKGFYVKMNLNGLLRGDIKSRAEYYSKALGGVPWMTTDQVRKLEDYNPLGGDANTLVYPANIIGNQKETNE